MIRPALALGLAAAVAGCTVGPDYRTPRVLTGTPPAPSLAGGAEAAFDPLAPLPASWWRLYDDPILDRLVEKALVRNTDLRQALANLEQMRAMLRESEVKRTPQTDLSAEASVGVSRIEAMGMTITQAPSKLYDISESVSYDLDLFGKLRRTIEESRDNVGEAKAMLDMMRVNVAGQTASAYAQACSTGLSIAVTERSVDVARRMLMLAQRRFDAGLNAANDVVQARTKLRETQAMLPSLLAQRRTSLFMLATLTGDPPTAFPPAVADCNAPPLLRQKIPVGDGAELIARRPDVRSAERKLASGVADIGVNTADLYPTIKLSGSVSALRTNLTGSDTTLLSGSIGPMITWTFPNVSATRAKIAAARAAARADLASFDGYVLTALREAESALVTLARDLDTEYYDSLARDDDARAYANAVRKYVGADRAGGLGRIDSVLDAENTLVSAENSLANATASVAKDQVTLFMKLGGGWQDAPAVAETQLDEVAVNRHPPTKRSTLRPPSP